MRVKVIDFEDNFAVCNYVDEDGYNAYGYLHTEEIDDFKIKITEKVKIGDILDAEVMYVTRGDNILTVKSAHGKTFRDRLCGLQKFDSVICKIIKETAKGAIANVKGIPAYIPGNFEIGTEVLASISKINDDKRMLLLNLESVFD